MEADRKVLDRVRKMLNLANDSAASEGERDNAMRMAYATLAKFNLSLSDVEKKEADTSREQVVFKGHHHLWSKRLANVVAQLFFCKMLSSGDRFYFIGRIDNVTTAQEMSLYLIKSILREARADYKTSPAQLTMSLAKFERDFAKGAADAIYWRCIAMRKEAEAKERGDAVPGTALVLASLYKTEEEANDQFIVELYKGKTRANKSRERSASAAGYNAGQNFGSNVSLNKQVK